MYDTHCHLTFKHYEGRVEQVIDEARAAGVKGLITVCTTTANAREGLALAETYDNVWCTAGVHPLHSDELRDWEEIRAVAMHPKCVAWGELGLDNHYKEPARSLQDDVLSEQIAFIESYAPGGLDRPVVVHCREAFDDLLDAFKSSSLDQSRFVYHCFTGGPDDARRVLDAGSWISFTGVVTFRNANEVAEAAKLVPLDRMMVETDAPFLTPAPMRKVFPNEPKYVVHTAQFLADLRGMRYEEMESVLDCNAEAFFGIGGLTGDHSESNPPP